MPYQFRAHNIRSSALALLLLLNTTFASAQPLSDARADIRKTYDFEPSQMSLMSRRGMHRR